MINAPAHKVILLLGSNIGNRQQWINTAINVISNQIGHVSQLSKIYESQPWGFQANQSFHNQAIEVKTNMGPRSVLHTIWKIEKKLGRIRSTSGYLSRTIDIDILTWENRIFWTKSLQVPHVQIQNRKFALQPLCELNGNAIHPVLEKSYNKLLSECKDKSWVRVVKEHHVSKS